MKKTLSIRQIMLLSSGFLVLLVAAMAGREMLRDWHVLTRTHTLKRAAHLDERMFDLLQQGSAEREITYAMLRTKDGASVERLKPSLAEARRNVDTATGDILALLPSFGLTDIGSEEEHAHAARDALFALRTEVDAAIKLAPGQRDPRLAVRWFDGSSALVGADYTLWLAFTRHFTTLDPIVTQRIMFQHFLGLIMRYAGRERAAIGGMIAAGEPISPVMQAQLLRWHGVIDQGWEMAARMSERSGLAPDITPYVTDAQGHYQTVYEMVQLLFFTPGAAPVTSYPITIEQWLTVAGDSTDSLVALKDKAIGMTRDYVDHLGAQARRDMLLHGLVLLTALSLSAYLMYVVNSRVVGPLEDMSQALLDAAEGKPVAAVPPGINKNDEIGRLARVLDRLQKKMDEANLLAAIIASSEDAIISKDLKEVITSWNAGAEHLFGYRAEEAIGQPVALIIPPEKVEEEKQLVDTLRREGKTEHIETVRMGRDQRRLDIALTVSPIRDAAGHVVGTSKIIRDIADRKEAEAKLLRYMADLERSNKELDDFAYIASHDLKEPLRGLHNHSRFLLEDNEGKLDKDSEDRLHRLLYLTQRMEKLVNDLLYFSRLGRQDLAIQKTDLNEVVHDIEGLIDVFLNERHAKIIVPKPLPVITCDKTRITEALRNLITNAVKYNDKDERIVEIGYLPETKGLGGKPAHDVIYVKDNGIGIPLEFHNEVFRIFKRLQSSKDSEEGTGVGLTFVKKIIERHGGTIWLESKSGLGTTFYFTLGRS